VSTLSCSNHHGIVWITAYYGHLGKIGHEVRKSATFCNKLDSLFMGIVVAKAVASRLLKQYALCLVENLICKGEEKSPCAGIGQELVRYPVLGRH
jgi:hypothetical protein